MDREPLCRLPFGLFRAASLAALALAVLTGATSGEESERGKDHPLVGRYEGSQLTTYRAPRFDTIALIREPLAENDRDVHLLQLEGRVSFYYYKLPPNRSTLEVARNFESSLKASGLEIVFSCGTTNGSCYVDRSRRSPGRLDAFLDNRISRWPENASRESNSNIGNACSSGDPRYLLARRGTGNDATTVSIAVCDGGFQGAFVTVVEGARSDADKLSDAAARSGRLSGEPGSDHPLVGRYEGARLTTWRPPHYDEIALVQEPVNEDDKDVRLLQIEGRVSFLYYRLPAERSTLEVQRSYEVGLKARGFEILFSCTTLDGSCYVDTTRHSTGRLLSILDNRTSRWPENAAGESGGNIGNACGGGDPRYVLARRGSGNDTVTVSVVVCDAGYTGAFVAVVEGTPMDRDKITFTHAAAMAPGEPGPDHTLVGRYEGARLTTWRPPRYDEVALIREPIAEEDRDVRFAELEGDVSFYYYKMPPDRSTLEVVRSYERALAAKGLTIVFACSTIDASCYIDKSRRSAGRLETVLNNGTTRWPENASRESGSNIGNSCSSGDPRYLLAKQETANGTNYVSIAVCDGGYEGIFVAVVRSRPMEINKVTFVNAAEMKKVLASAGRIDLFGIFFDSDRDTIRPDSKPTLDEIVKLMNADPQLHLQLVGHSDASEGDSGDGELSRRRAMSVLQTLSEAGIGRERLTARGAGASEPVAPDSSEEGRARNRRVELVGM